MKAYTNWLLDTRTDEEWVAAIQDEIDHEDSIEWLFAPEPVDDSQLELDFFDYDAEADDYENAMLDNEHHARGMW